MPFVSELAHLAIDDPPAVDGGFMPRDENADPWGGYAAPFPLPLIPESEWPERIEEMERTKSRLSDVAAFVKMPPNYQFYSNYCWGFCLKRAVELTRASQGHPHIDLSGTSLCAPVSNYANPNGSPQGVGGWPSMALKYAAEVGIDTLAGWPEMKISRKFDTEESRQRKAQFRVTEWVDLRPRNFEELMTCLLLRIPVAMAHNRWRHAVCAVDPLWTKSGPAVLTHNSGAGRDKNGITVLSRKFGPPDTAVAPKVTTGA